MFDCVCVCLFNYPHALSHTFDLENKNNLIMPTDKMSSLVLKSHLTGVPEPFI